MGALSIAKPVGENEAIFGTVTNQDVADAIKAAAKVEVDKREIIVPDINHLGEYSITLKLHPEVSIDLKVNVVAA